MRTRTINRGPCPVITTREYSWNTSLSPWKRQYVTNTSYSPDVNTNVPNGFDTYVETMTDAGVGYQELRQGFKPCLHTVDTNVFWNDYVALRYPSACAGNAHMRLIQPSHVSESLALRERPDVDMDAMADEALAFMLPHINQGSSLINFALELKDLKSWFRGGHAIARIKGRYLDKNGRYLPRGVRPHSLEHMPYNDLSFRLKGGRTKMFKDIAVRITGAHLEASFGIVPFVRDIHDAVQGLAELDYKVQLLKRYSSIPQSRHYRRYIPDSSGVAAHREWVVSYTPVSWPSGPGFDDFTIHRPPMTLSKAARWIKRPVYSATARYNYTVPMLGELETRIKTSMDSLGLSLDPSIIWNAIPYTFMVDWIVDVSGFLHSFARDNFPIKVNLTDFCHSLACHSESIVRCQYPASTYTGGGYGTVLPDLTEARDVVMYTGTRSYYNRVRVIPDIHAIATKRLKLKQAALAGSLLLNKALGGRRSYRTN